MINAAVNSGQFWDFEGTTPQPTQDADLLKQLGFIPGFKEMLLLRQVHALEHATVWVLSENQEKTQNLEESNPLPTDNETLGGLSTDQGFYLYGQVNLSQLRKAVRVALQRMQAGEWKLAIHPRCGTNLSVALLLTTGMVLGVSLLFPRNPIEQLIGAGIATFTAFQIAPDLGSTAQKYITTAIPFNLEIVEISATSDFWGRSAHFVRVQWRDLQ
jgi:hypothetical protein